mgnify:CR=1 FL=1
MTSKRTRILSLFALLLWLGGAQLAHAQQGGRPYEPAFHPDVLKGPPVGAANEVLVLCPDIAIYAPLIDAARREAETLLDEDPDLKRLDHQALKASIATRVASVVAETH